MIREITIKNIRGIREGHLSGFTRIVVLVGPNNSGKSTVLDSLMLGAYSNPQQPQNNLNWVSVRRNGLEGAHQWLLFRENGARADRGEIHLKGDTDKVRVSTVLHLSADENSGLFISTRFSSDPPPPTQQPRNVQETRPPLDDVPAIRLVDTTRKGKSLAELFTEVTKRGLKDSVKSTISELLPDVTDIGIFLEGQQGSPVVYLDYKTGAKPVALAGDGVQQLILQTLELASPLDGTVLLEEPETHLHPRAILQSARAIIAAASRGIQVILTTHSLDLIDMLLAETKPEELDDLSFYRLQLRNGDLQSSRFSGSEASFSRGQIEDDLR